MLIQSNFRDYYDSVIGFGVDKTVVFKRQKRILSHVFRAVPGRDADNDLQVEIKKIFIAQQTRLKNLINDKYETVLVGFCGNIYHGLVSRKATEDGNLRFGWSLNDFSEEELAEGEAEDLAGGSVFNKPCLRSIRQWFRVNNNKLVIPCAELFAAHSLVSFAYIHESQSKFPRDELVINPCLKDYRFQRKIEPFTAFQTISMHIAGALHKEAIPEPISDILRAQTHGFDKFSFRRS